MLNITPNEALYDISYINAIMYGKALPMYGDVSENEGVIFDESLDANDVSIADKFGSEQSVRV